MITVMRWYTQDEVNQEDSEQNEVDGMKKGVDSTGKVMHRLWWFSYESEKQVVLRLYFDNCTGYNCSLFAYGQTGSGKSYSLIGYGTNK